MSRNRFDHDGSREKCAPADRDGAALNRRSFMVGGAALSWSLLSTKGATAAAAYRIDVHHHILPPQYLAKAPPSANALQFFKWWTPQKSLEEMDQNGVTLAMLSFPTPYMWFSGAEFGRQLARMCNDYSKQLARDNPGRFGLFAGVPPLDDTDGCLSEIEYAYGTLKTDGITVMTSYGGRYPGDAAFAPVWEELNRRKAVVFVHPCDPACCTAVNYGVPTAFGEFPFDTARACMSLWTSNALQRFPNIRFIFSHGGGALPMIADRIDKFGRPQTASATSPSAPPLHDAFPAIRAWYFDTANAANPAAFAATWAMANHGHVLFGSDYPYVPPRRGVDDLAHAPLSEAERRAVERDNALALMPQLRSRSNRP
jgi:predicted TIM-barrel fold metal-dependent hydrolase